MFTTHTCCCSCSCCSSRCCRHLTLPRPRALQHDTTIAAASTSTSTSTASRDASSSSLALLHTQHTSLKLLDAVVSQVQLSEARQPRQARQLCQDVSRQIACCQVDECAELCCAVKSVAVSVQAAQAGQALRAARVESGVKVVMRGVPANTIKLTVAACLCSKYTCTNSQHKTKYE